MTAYCLERKLPINRCGKLVVATNESELPRLEELYRRGLANGVALMDFVLEGDARSMHILNVVSPGLTCALSFAEYVVDAMRNAGVPAG